MLRQIERTIRRRGMLAAGERVGVAVSGGSDSMALLFALRELAERLGVAVGVAHFNHRLRGEESDADQRFVEALAARLELRCFTASADISALAKARRENVEQLGRERRYEWFSALIDGGVFDKIALGHTRDDQAETVLFRLLRGTGTTGLAGVRAKLEGGIVRPMIEVERVQAREFLRDRGERWREDSSNNDLAFSRNRIRAELLPLLARDWNPNIIAILARTAEIAADEEEYWERTVAASAKHFRRDGAALLFDAGLAAQVPKALLRRLLREAARRVRGDLKRLGAGHVELLLELAAQPRGDGRLELPGLLAERSFDQIRLTTPDKARQERSENRLVREPGKFPAPAGSGSVDLAVQALPGEIGSYNDAVWGLLDWEKAPRPLELRCWQAGDRLRPCGFRTEHKLARLFKRAHVTAWDRSVWPVLAAAGSREGEQALVWARGFGVSANFAADEQSRAVVRVSARDAAGREFSGIKLGPGRVYKARAALAEQAAREETT